MRSPDHRRRRAGPPRHPHQQRAQTVRRLPCRVRRAVEGESAPAAAGELPAHHVIGAFDSGAVDGLATALPAGPRPGRPEGRRPLPWSPATPASPGTTTAPPSTRAGSSPTSSTATPGRRRSTQIAPVELLETQLCNYTAPFILISNLRRRWPSRANAADARYVVNVSAMEGVRPRLQGRGPPAHEHRQGRDEHADAHQRPGDVPDRRHPHDLRRHRLDHRRAPAPDKLRLADEGFHAPLDLVDGAARVYDPIVRGEAGEDLYGVFLKDYAPATW